MNTYMTRKFSNKNGFDAPYMLQISVEKHMKDLKYAHQSIKDARDNGISISSIIETHWLCICFFNIRRLKSTVSS